ncbi:MAG: hypothetical protein ACD_77C00477G0025 [uncultured bacterium]|nr:MAG: hypothetical protein ACD_77C00477G0025 [uncultured bacterium]HBY02698.1 glycosyltransferase family 1 protein [Rikenellaceae bacterium]
MKIAIEAQRIFRENKHGMDFVALECIRELQKIDKVNDYYILVGSGPDHDVLLETPNFHIIEIKIPTYPLWEQLGIPLAIKKIKPDLLHCTSNTAPFCVNTTLLLTLHDIIFLEKRKTISKSLYQNLGWYYRKFVVPRAIRNSKKIITVSDFESKRIKDRLNLPASKISYIYNGFGKHFRKIEDYYEITSKYISAREYFFFLGNTDPKKNTENVLKAYGIYLKKSTCKKPLLIADLKESHVDSILTKLSLEHIKNNLVICDYIPNPDLPYIFSGALLFLYPSLRESFGIPILESMACGTPVITSNTSAMPEIAGDAALLVDPYSPEAIAEGILKIETDENFRKELINSGNERIKLFSWEKTATELLKIYKNIVNHEMV